MSFFIVYDERPRGKFTGRIGDPVQGYLWHYDNLLLLERACQIYDGPKRFQAEKEMRLCKDKLEWWSKRPGFVMPATECQRRRALWVPLLPS